MRLRRKITVAFFLVSTLVSAVLAATLYRFVEHQLEVELFEVKGKGAMQTYLVTGRPERAGPAVLAG